MNLFERRWYYKCLFTLSLQVLCMRTWLIVQEFSQTVKLDIISFLSLVSNLSLFYLSLLQTFTSFLLLFIRSMTLWYGLQPGTAILLYLYSVLSIFYSFGTIICNGMNATFTSCSMKWIKVKMEQLGVLGNPNYKITALLDHMAMITVQTSSRGVFDCKPLGLIWAKFPEV